MEGTEKNIGIIIPNDADPRRGRNPHMRAIRCLYFIRKGHSMTRKRLLLGLICAILLFVLIASNDNEIVQGVSQFFISDDGHDTSCYEEPSTTDGITDFDASAEHSGPKQGRNIFFHETSCFGVDGATLNARQACAVESAAKMNPEMTVFVLFTSPTRISNASKTIVRQLMTYENVKLRHILMEDYVRGTPLAEWYSSGVLKSSLWPNSHMSDILRYLTLWKFGGIYLDLDVVVTTSFKDLVNFAGAENWEDVAAGVMGFGPTGLGRRVAEACLNDLRRNFRGDVWGNNGPGVITRTLQKICTTKLTRKMTSSRCQGFTVHPPSAFYPIHYKQWRRYFDAKGGNETMALLRKARAIHVWNKLSKSQNVVVGSQVPYALIAQQYCPRVYANCGTDF